MKPSMYINHRGTTGEIVMNYHTFSTSPYPVIAKMVSNSVGKSYLSRHDRRVRNGKIAK